MRATPRPLRVMETFEPSAGGIPEHVLHLSLGLAGRGHEVVVSGPPDARPREALEAAGLRYVALPWTGSVPGGGVDVEVLRGLGSVLQEGDFDLLHAHGQKAGLLARAAAWRRRVPSIYTAHSLVYRTQMVRPRRGRRARRAANLAAERLMGRTTAAFVAVAREEGEAAVGDRLLPRSRVRLVEYGVAPDTTIPPDPELIRFRGDGPLLGFVATLRDQKGLPTLIDALERLASSDSAPRFAIVGDGPMRDEVADRLRDGPAGRRTLLRGFGGRVEPYLAAFDAMVLPSLWEGMPIAVLEAMAMGVPVVASRVNGTPEAVSEGRTGLLVPPADPAALAEAIARMAADGAMRERMSSASREEAARRFTIPRMVDEVETLYREIAARTP